MGPALIFRGRYQGGLKFGLILFKSLVLELGISVQALLACNPNILGLAQYGLISAKGSGQLTKLNTSLLQLFACTARLETYLGKKKTHLNTIELYARPTAQKYLPM